MAAKKEKSPLTEKALEDSSAVLVPRRQNAPVGQMERRLWAEAVEEVEAEPRACNSVECQSPIQTHGFPDVYISKFRI